MHWMLEIVGLVGLAAPQLTAPTWACGWFLHSPLNAPPSFFVTFASFCSKLVHTGQGKHCARGPAGFDEQRINGVSFMLEQKGYLQHPNAGISHDFHRPNPTPGTA